MHNMTKICEFEDRLVGYVDQELAKPMEEVDAHELGEVVDVLKDLAELKRNCHEARYYEQVVDAMESSEYANHRYGYSDPDERGFRMRGGTDEENELYSNMRDRLGRRVHSMDDYDEYLDARRHYTETRAASDRGKMNGHAEAHLNQVLETVKDIWGSADQAFKNQMKTELKAFVDGLA